MCRCGRGSTHHLLLTTDYLLRTADGLPRVGAVEAARGKAEVAQLDVTLRVEQHVLGLEIAVDHLG